MKSKYLLHTALIISISVFTTFAFAEDANSDKSVIENAKAVQPGSLTTVIANSLTFSTLTKALKTTELDLTLGGTDTYTIFGPTDEAFDKLPVETLTKLMLPDNKGKTPHVVTLTCNRR